MKVNMLQLRLALIALRFEARTGMLMTSPRKVNTYRWVANLLGYPPKAKPTKHELANRLEALIQDAEAIEKELKCVTE